MTFINNWYTNPSIVNIYSSFRGKDLVSLSKHLNDDFSNAKFLKYEFNQTINFLPINSYSSFLINNEKSIEVLDQYIKRINSINITTLYLPLISNLNLKEILPSKYKEIYSERLNSYYIDLTKNETELKNNISKRKRNKIQIKGKNWDFNIANKVEEEFFCKLHTKFMSDVGANKTQTLQPKFIKKILKLKNHLLFRLKIDDQIELMHLIGLNSKKDSADFVFAASTNNGYSYGYLMLWQEINYLKSLGLKTFYLGGGILKNDGVDNFKKRMGGQVLYNGGLKIVVDKINYANEFSKFKQANNVNNFFPIYLKDQILSNT